ncbi:MAG: AAA family ATPase [Phototrophicales bacterium]|nr:MAG: AAA family ATPase [Phototrophicales bacterium]RMG78007.1 MAG: AAA family ATPase [Chloroflexota bacterium]
MERRITDDIDRLKKVLPPHINNALDDIDNNDNLLEIVLDLGRRPTARFTDGEIELSDDEVDQRDIDLIVQNIGDFDADNRAGMERTLHRISAIRNRKGDVVGLTCRVGRAVYGTIDIIEDLIMSGQNVLLLGSPGVGKTTMLREAARVLAEKKRVVIVDTSNEIGGDGDVPHPAVGKARRMQVSHPERQHEVMIEAVENHNPEVIVIDEIGRELEAQAARTIAERGVQLIGTAHGNALDNLMLNPTLSDLIGGIESVTLSDDEARRRGTQKTVLERRAPPTFDVLVEIQTRDRLAVHPSVADAVDGMLRGRVLPVEMRIRDKNGEIHVETIRPEMRDVTMTDISGRKPGRNGNTGHNPGLRSTITPNVHPVTGKDKADVEDYIPSVLNGAPLEPMSVYAYGVARNRLQQAARRLHVPLDVTEDLGSADAVVTMKNYYRRRPRLIVDAERRGMPIYVLRANTVSQMENFLIDVFRLEVNPLDPFGEALRETEQAIMQIRAGQPFVDLQPQDSIVRRRQHQMIRKEQLASRSLGVEPERFVRIFRQEPD